MTVGTFGHTGEVSILVGSLKPGDIIVDYGQYFLVLEVKIPELYTQFPTQVYNVTLRLWCLATQTERLSILSCLRYQVCYPVKRT